MLTPAKKEFIEFMMSADVLRFGSFVTKSGRNTPYFVNTGNYRTGGQISRLGSFYAALVKETCGEDFDAMFGPAYKGIPLATAAAGALAREFGIEDGDRIIIIEDVITAGTAVRETMPVLKACGNVEVRDMFISVNRCEVGQTPGKTAIMEVQEEFGIRVHALVTVQDIYEYLKEQGTYGEVLPAMEKYMADYCVL